MAINFEAANMAGYNNPKIEAFKAIIDLGTNAISNAPSRTEIISCLRKGSIPAILLTSQDASMSFLLWISGWGATEKGDAIEFSNRRFTIAYNPDSDLPIPK